MNKIKEVVQTFRSGSAESPASFVPGAASTPTGASGSSAKSEVDQRGSPKNTVWTTGQPPNYQPITPFDPTSAEKVADKIMKNLSPEELKFSVETALNRDHGSGAGDPDSYSKLDRKSSKKKPKGTIEYTVKDGETLNGIGAHFDVTLSELKKINKMWGSRPTVFTGQILFLPDPSYIPSDPPSPVCGSPVDTRTRVDIPLASQADKPPAVIPGHVVQVSPSKVTARTIQGRVLDRSLSDADELDHECLQKFVKIPARRVMEEAFGNDIEVEGKICRGTLLVTPNAIMFDPDMDEQGQNQTEFAMVVNMTQVKGVAMFYSMAKMFWRQSKEQRALSPRPEIFRSADAKRSPAEGTDEVTSDIGSRTSPSGSASGPRPPPDGSSNVSQRRTSPEGAGQSGETVPSNVGEEVTGRTSEELENMTQATVVSTSIHPGRASQEVENAMTRDGHMTVSPQASMSRSSELAVNEISLLQDSDMLGGTRDFGPHLGRTSSDMNHHRGTSRLSQSSPADVGHTDRSDSTTESLSTPTQGFAPVTFTDRSPNTNSAVHPKPVPVQGRTAAPRVSPNHATDLKSRENRISEEVESSDDKGKRLSGGNPADTLDDTVSISVSDSQNKDLSPRPDPESTSSVADSSNPGTETSSATSTLISSARLGSSFAPLKLPAQHISSLFNYTTSLFRGGGDRDTKTGQSANQEGDMDGEIARLTLDAAQEDMRFPLVQGGFSKEEINKSLGPEKSAHAKSDSPHFLEPPLYLQIRPGIKKDGATGPTSEPPSQKLLEEYWFVVPRNMGDKLYQFLIDWQPSAYGDQDELESRDKYFYNISEVQDRIQPINAPDVDILEISENHYSIDMRSWEVLSADEAGLTLNRSERNETLDDNMPQLIGSSSIITSQHVTQLVHVIPPTMSAGYDWALVFSTRKHGYSLRNLYRQMAQVEDGPCLLFIKDTQHNVFGAYLSDNIKTSETFYGHGTTFLFTFYPEFKKFNWKGENNFFINGTTDFFAIGAGKGLFGLWIDNDLNHGRSHQCLTFENDVLSSNEDFRIIDVEAWSFIDCTQT